MRRDAPCRRAPAPSVSPTAPHTPPTPSTPPHARPARPRRRVTTRVGLAVATLLVAGLVPRTPAQLTDLQPGRNFTQSAAFGTHRSWEIAVGDCDQDGDLDVIVANGGDGGPQDNRIFINLGGMQAGAIGTFADETATRFAGVPSDKSRDCEFVDIDQDGDLDIHISNDAHQSQGGAPNRFYRNLGGLQGGAVGYYAEDTDAAYGTLVSVPLAQQVHGGNEGPFRDFSCDCDFADLDDDGDLDMFHSSYGPNTGGQRDSLVFLNDGTGRYDELWPWADPAADIKTHVFRFDLADLDDDFDIDVFVSSRDSQARVYLNNLYGALGARPFQDVTKAALLDNNAQYFGSNNYDVECADLDGDGDFDAWMNGYASNGDRILENQGVVDGVPQFAIVMPWIVGDPFQNEQTNKVLDYDGDGDLDMLAPNFSGTNHLYQSGAAQGLVPATQGLFHRTEAAGTLAGGFPELPSTGNGSTTSSGAAGDVDGDGDEDILIANDGGQQNRLFTNALGVPDVHAPAIHKLTAQGDKPLGDDVVIHASVLDNSAPMLVEFYAAALVYAVDGGAPVSTPMRAQGAQLFRGTIPGSLAGEIAWHVEVTDLAGNTGVSATQSFVQGDPGPWTNLGSGLSGLGGVPSLVGTGTLVAGSPGTLDLTGAASSASAALFVSLSSTPAPFKGGTLVPVPVLLTLPLVTDGAGSIALAWASWPGGLPGGTTLYLQVAIADAGGPAGLALSNALLGVTP